MKPAWAAWKAATAFLFWSAVHAFISAVRLDKEAARRLEILNPETVQQLFDHDFAIFAYDVGQDAWRGGWRAKGEKPGPLDETFWLVEFRGVPLHAVNVQELPGLHCYAVPLNYARKHLTKLPWKEAA